MPLDKVTEALGDLRDLPNKQATALMDLKKTRELALKALKEQTGGHGAAWISATKELKKYIADEEAGIKSTKNLASSFSELNKAIKASKEDLNKVAKDFLGFKKASKEAKEEVDKLSKSMGSLAKIGPVNAAALVYLVKNLSDLTKGFEDVSSAVARSNINQAMLSKTTIYSANSIKQLRGELGLTYKEFGKLQSAIEAASDAGLDLKDVKSTISALRANLGEEQAASMAPDQLRLQGRNSALKGGGGAGYVGENMMGLIASGDIKTALAGMSGGLYGGKGGTADDQDKDVLETQKSIDKGVSGIKEFIANNLPAFSQYLPAAVDGITGTIAAIGSLGGIVTQLTLEIGDILIGQSRKL